MQAITSFTSVRDHVPSIDRRILLLRYIFQVYYGYLCSYLKLLSDDSLIPYHNY